MVSRTGIAGALAVLLALLSIVQPVFCENGSAFDSYVSSPANIPLFANFTTPQIEPGDSGTYGFIARNRYTENMTNVVLTVEIYMWATEDGSEEIASVPDRPTIKEGAGQLDEFKASSWTGVSRQGADTNVSNWTISMTMESGEDTPTGTYFTRHSLSFIYQGEQRVMKSRGYFTRENWDAATTNSSSNPGGINLTLLEVDGIIPDSAFGVKKPFPQWPKYVLLGLAILCGVLALVFYLMEEEGKFKWLKVKLFRAKGKVERAKVDLDLGPKSLTKKSPAQARKEIKEAREKLRKM